MNCKLLIGASALALAAGHPCWASSLAQAPPPYSSPPPTASTAPVGEVVITGKFDALHLDDHAQAATRLGLSLRETPAAVEVLTQEQLQVRGLRTTREAFGDITGAISGDVPGNPATVTLRGFSSNTVSVLFDGVRTGASTIVTRDVDSWNYERIEAIKGPASVIAGEGALAGVINLVTKKPRLDGPSGAALASYGSFNTGRIAFDVNTPVSDHAAVRISAAYLNSDSLYDIRDNHYRSAVATVAGLYRPDDRLSVLAAVDYSYDRSNATYQGSPLVPRTLARDPSDVVTSTNGLDVDAATRRVNYNPFGGFQDAESVTARAQLTYALGGGWSLRDDAFWIHSDRSFVYSNDQTSQASTGLLTRSVREIFNDQTFWADRVAVGYDGPLFGRRNRFSAGVEYNHTDFYDPRELGRLVPVTPFDPVRGRVPSRAVANFPGAGNAVLFTTDLDQTSLFLEDAYDLTDRLILVGGVRYEAIDLDRTVRDLNLNTATRFTPSFRPLSGRVGAVYTVAPGVQAYAQYSTAVVPVGSLLVLTTASGAFDLSRGDVVEGGLKVTALHDRLSITAAGYRIGLDDILTLDPVTSLSVQGGTQSSRGAELTVGANPLPNLHVDVGAAYIDARYDRLMEAGGANRAGKRPVNAPATTLNAAVLYSLPRLPVTFGAFITHVGDFYTDTANTIRVNARTTLDASVTWRLAGGALVLRGRNLTDVLYGEYSGYPATQVYLGAPRSFDVTWTGSF